MANRTVPYPGYSYLVIVTDSVGLASTLGGFSKVLGLAIGSTTVTLQRGAVSASVLSLWMNQVRAATAGAGQGAVITQRGLSGQSMMSWQLAGVTPASYIGPALAGKGQSDVPLQELVLTVGNVQIIAPVSFVAGARFRPMSRL
jgi:hypothetical protein